MAFADFELPYIPSLPKRATEASRPFCAVAPTPLGRCSLNRSADSSCCHSSFPLAKTSRAVTQSSTGPSDVRHHIPLSAPEAHSVVVLAPYGLTDTTASSSVDGWCRDVTVTHSPGFTVLIAASALSGTFMRIVRY